MRRLGHQPALDGLRGIAILLVVAMHTGGYAALGWTAGGILGVDLFFVLSGFLITSLLLAEWDRNGVISLRDFYRRRARRLLPALVVCVGFLLVLTLTTTPSRTTTVLRTAIVALSYVANVFRALGVPPGLFGHFWSLAQEEQFYLVWPLALVVLIRRGTRPTRLLLLLTAAIVAVNVERLGLIASGASAQRVWFAPDTHADPLLFGCAAAVVWSYGLVQVSRRAGWLAVAVGLSIVLLFRSGNLWEFPVALPVFALACAVTLLALLEHPSSRLARTLATPPLRSAGKISYALYLWHSPLLVLYGLPGVPMALAASVLSYRFVERPFLRRGRAERVAWARLGTTVQDAGPAAVLPGKEIPLLEEGAVSG